jgi:zona occludens toxin (predicted ATPase)
MQMMFDYLNKPHDPDQPIRQIYSNIDGLKVPGVLKMPDDWRDTPDGSIIFIDEAQMLPAYTKREDKWVENHLKKQYAEIKQELQIHRHTGHDIILLHSILDY